MKKQGLKIRAALFLVTAALASSPVLTSVAAATKKDVSSAKDKKSALEQEKKKTEEAIKSLQGLKSNTESYVKELDTKMNDLQSQVTKLENNISSKQKSIDETAVKLEEAQKTEKKQYASMKMRIKYMYEKGDSSYLNLLLEARSLSELLNRAEYVSKISEYDRKMLDQYVATKESIADSKKKLETEKAELQEMKTQTEAKQDSVQLLLNEKNKELQNVNAQIGEKSAQAKAYEKPRSRRWRRRLRRRKRKRRRKKRQRKLPEKLPQRERRIIRPRKGILAVRLPLRREVLRCAGRALQADALHLDTENVNHRRRARPRTIRALISALRPAAASWQPPEERFRLQPTVIRLEIMLWSTMEMDFQPCICTVPSFWYRQGIR